MQTNLFQGLFQSKIICGFSRRNYGDMSLSETDIKDSLPCRQKQSLLQNRKIFLEGLGIDYQSLVCCQQKHSSFVKIITKADAGCGALSEDTAIPNTDALVTNEKNLPLAIFTADCLPIFLYDSHTNSIGLVHAGWRGMREKILINTLKVMKERFNSRAKDVYAGFGPAIRSCCYEVEHNFKTLFPSDLIERNNHSYLDLVKINKKQVLDWGVKKTNIFDSNLCTSCHNADLFSFRKEGQSCGRMMSVIMLK